MPQPYPWGDARNKGGLALTTRARAQSQGQSLFLRHLTVGRTSEGDTSAPTPMPVPKEGLVLHSQTKVTAFLPVTSPTPHG